MEYYEISENLKYACYRSKLGKPLFKKRHLYLGIARKGGGGGGGGLNPCPDGLGHFFREEFTKFKRAFA